MDHLIQTMMHLIRYEIMQEPLPETIREGLSGDALKSLYRLSKAHDLAHLVGAALDENHLLPQEAPVSEKFRRQTMMAIYRYQQLQYELNQICQTFEEAKIPFIPLKGSVLRQYYPQPWMRTSCDVDILVHESDLEKASGELVERLSYKQEGKGSHDIAFDTPIGMHIELHYDLIEEHVNDQSEQPMKNVWNSSYAKPNSVRHNMTDEMFYYYHVAHMAKHFVHGGCGIRPFLDLWILNHRMPYDEAKRKALLEEGGLLLFEQTAVKLSEVWLSNAGPDELTDTMANYILSGGVYGNTENRVAVQQQKKGGKFRYIMFRIFLPYSVLKFHYPVLQKHKWLLPFMEIRRWFKLIFKGGLKRSTNEMKINQSMSAEKQSETAWMMDQLGLTK